MPTPGNERYGRLYEAAMRDAARRFSEAKSVDWAASTPCEEWNTRDLLNHLTGENLWAVELLAGRTTKDVGARLDGDLTGDDPVETYARSVESASIAVSAPGAMDATCHLSFGDFPGFEYAKQLFLDTLVHTWDFATATGGDRRLDTDLVDAATPVAQELRGMFGEYGVFGDDLRQEAPADPQSQLLGLLGRTG